MIYGVAFKNISPNGQKIAFSNHTLEEDFLLCKRAATIPPRMAPSFLLVTSLVQRYIVFLAEKKLIWSKILHDVLIGGGNGKFAGVRKFQR